MAYQVVISYKHGEARDHDMAQELCNDLKNAGAEVFCSEKDLSEAAAMPEIYHALGEAAILIVVGTSRDNMESKWVAGEWSKYQSAILNESKAGCEIIAYIEGMGEKDVPFGLNDVPSFDSAHKGDIIKKVKDKLGIQDPPPKEEDNGMWGRLLVCALMMAALAALYFHYNKPAADISWSRSLNPARLIEYFQREFEPPQRTRTVSSILSIDEIAVGDRLTFGTWEQDSDTSNGTEPVEWRVIAVEDGRALLLSEYLLDYRPYHKTYADVTWENCSLRAWLNNDFIDQVFNVEEQYRIAFALNRNPASPDGAEGGSDTPDKIFLLSADEVSRYLASDGDRQAFTTDAAHDRGSDFSDRSDYWWLRSPGKTADSAVCVGASGGVQDNGVFVDYDEIAVRPALWLEP